MLIVRQMLPGGKSHSTLCTETIDIANHTGNEGYTDRCTVASKASSGVRTGQDKLRRLRMPCSTSATLNLSQLPLERDCFISVCGAMSRDVRQLGACMLQ
jgi:hypothetical protein